MYDEPLTRRGGLIVRSMWDVLRNINLVTGVRRCPEFQFIPVIDRAFAFQKVSDGLNTLVMVDLRFCPGRHRQNVHANLLRAYRLGGGPGGLYFAYLWKRRHPDAEMFMGIGNLTELTEADTTGVTAMLLGFCQELGIRNVLTTEVIDWARGAVREAVIAAELMHFAHVRGTPPKHIDGRLLTVKDEEFRPYAEDELRELQG